MSSRQQPLSRRDWFRLRLPGRGHDLLGSEAPAGLHALDEPCPREGPDVAGLPALHEALLSAEQVRALFADLQHCATNVQLRARDAANAEHLVLACDRLLAGSITKLQARYEWQGSRWIDTLERKPGGVRLVRMKHG